MNELIFNLLDEHATINLAARLAHRAQPGDIITLIGALGVGKTVFARAFISAAGGGNEVPSPTFTLLQTYDVGTTTLYHFDLYRLRNPEDAYELDIEDAFFDGISLIEWPDRIEALLPIDRLDLHLKMGKKPHMRCAILNGGLSWESRLTGL